MRPYTKNGLIGLANTLKSENSIGDFPHAKLLSTADKLDESTVNEDLEKLKDIIIPNTQKNRDILRIAKEKNKDILDIGREFCPECDGDEIFISKANHYFLKHEKLLEKLIKNHEEKKVGKYMVELSGQIAKGLHLMSKFKNNKIDNDPEWMPDILTYERIEEFLVEGILMCDSNRYKEELGL